MAFVTANTTPIIVRRAETDSRKYFKDPSGCLGSCLYTRHEAPSASAFVDTLNFPEPSEACHASSTSRPLVASKPCH